MQLLGKSYLTARQVCTRYGMSLRTLNRRVFDPQFPKSIMLERRRFFAEADLIAWEERVASEAGSPQQQAA